MDMPQSMQRKISRNSLQTANHAVLLSGALTVALFAVPACPQPAVVLEKALSHIRSMKTLSCSFVRKQSYQGINKTAKGAFYHDRRKGKFVYVYASPYDYSFWVDDSAVCGLDRNGKRGYVTKASIDSRRYRSLLESVHICGPRFKFDRMDTLRVSFKASIDDFLYFECPTGSGREVLKVNRNGNCITLIETFDSGGAVMRQTIFEYDTTNGKAAMFPKKIITRGNETGAIETDTLLFSKVEINKKIKEAVFLPPAFTEIGIGK
jgi:outer membrane lipoprotein-sorting protein